MKLTENEGRPAVADGSTVERVARALHISCSRQDIHGYLDAKIDCTVLAEAALAALPPERDQHQGETLREAVTKMRDLAKSNLRQSDKPHTVTMNGERHSGPIVDAWVDFLKLMIRVFDAALPPEALQAEEKQDA